ncbi:diguanylate cyclase [Desulfotomaculum sp. 1211_IL3151]|uniref:diguanylate cyclase n=1 Tax=Desulfotomaculum sp. 1211_IL3151 TaxID=3084055 RepID=UPI002FD89873
MNNKVKILVVEDSRTQAEQLRYILEQNGYQVHVTYNGVQALDYISSNKPSIIISDIIMPEMDGYDLCKAVKTNEGLKGIPVILLTGLSDAKDVIKGLSCGADNFVTKPFNEQFLLSRIRHILINQELRRCGSTEMGMEVFFEGQKHFLTSERMQIIDLLLSTFENAVQKNLELEQSNNQLKDALNKIKILEHNYRTILEKNSDAMVVADCQGVMCYVNPAAETLFGCSAKEIMDQPFKYSMASGEKKEVTIERLNKDRLVAEMHVVEINWEGKNAYLASLRDVTENVQLREKLRNLSLRDELTGLYNRRGFITLTEQQLKVTKRAGEKLMLFFVDLDKLKMINDQLGHHEGDQALIDTANILIKTFRESDIISRLGGDEFAVLVLGDQKDRVPQLTARLMDHVNRHNAKGIRQYGISLSFGIAFFDAELPCSLDELINTADKNMYQNKRSKVWTCKF